MPATKTDRVAVTVAFVAGGTEEDIREARAILKEAGVSIDSTMRVEGLWRPEVIHEGKTYRGLKEIKQFTQIVKSIKG